MRLSATHFSATARRGQSRSRAPHAGDSCGIPIHLSVAARKPPSPTTPSRPSCRFPDYNAGCALRTRSRKYDSNHWPDRGASLAESGPTQPWVSPNSQAGNVRGSTWNHRKYRVEGSRGPPGSTQSRLIAAEGDHDRLPASLFEARDGTGAYTKAAARGAEHGVDGPAEIPRQ